MPEIHRKIMDALPPGVELRLGELSAKAGASRRIVLDACLILESQELVSVRKPFLGLLGDYGVRKARDLTPDEEKNLGCKVIAVANQKGGVGKTITAINVAACLSKLGRRTLLIDLDPQANSTNTLSSESKANVYDALTGWKPADEAIVKTGFDNLELMPSDINLAGAEIELACMRGRENKLKAIVDEIRGGYEYIIIDCPPSLSLLTINALAACDSVLIPVQCDYFALDGLKQLMNTIDLVRTRLNNSLRIEGIVLTMYEPQNKLSVKIAREVEGNFRNNVLTPTIHRDVMLSESVNQRKPIVYYDAGSRASKEYTELTNAIMQNG